jgi:hypothetical protein
MRSSTVLNGPPPTIMCQRGYVGTRDFTASFRAVALGTRCPFEGEKLQELMGLIARGLVWYHWKTYLNDESHSVVVKTVTGPGAAYFKNVVFKFKARNRVEQTIGRDIFKYEGLQGIDAPELTIWRLAVYGGLVVGDASGKQFASDFIVTTGPKTMFQRIDEENARIMESQARWSGS